MNIKSPVVLVPGIIGILILVYGVIQSVWTFIILGVVVGLAGIVYSAVSGDKPEAPKEETTTEETSIETPPTPEMPPTPETPEQPEQPTSTPSF